MQYRRITEVIEDDSKTERPSGHSSSANPKILKGAPDRDHVFVGPKTPAEADSLEDDVTQFKRVHIVAAPDVDDLSAQLGSSALLDDSDVPFSTHLSHSPPGAPVPSGFGLSRASVGTPLFPNPLSCEFSYSPRYFLMNSYINVYPLAAKYPSFSGQGNSSWATYSLFGVPFPSPWNAAAGPSWPNRPFSASGPYRTYASRRPVAIRLLIIQAIKHLSSTSSLEFAPGFYEVNLLLNQVEQLKPPNEPAIRLTEMMDICDTEGSSQNGGGSFTVEQDESGKL
ncbi:hypothetical protein EIK77_010111 [Talaromyces pinophilus]|nr:hypothetical protein EIK77_010111 [Talaromyces pinophilus]